MYDDPELLTLMLDIITFIIEVLFEYLLHIAGIVHQLTHLHTCNVESPESYFGTFLRILMYIDHIKYSQSFTFELKFYLLMHCINMKMKRLFKARMFYNLHFLRYYVCIVVIIKQINLIKKYTHTFSFAFGEILLYDSHRRRRRKNNLKCSTNLCL